MKKGQLKMKAVRKKKSRSPRDRDDPNVKARIKLLLEYPEPICEIFICVIPAKNKKGEMWGASLGYGSDPSRLDFARRLIGNVLGEGVVK